MPTKIFLAYGLHFRDTDWLDAFELLVDRCDEIAGEQDAFVFPSGSKKPKYEIRALFDKAGFAKALDEKDAVVVFDGDSRLGQGPSFGAERVGRVPDKNAFPANPWGGHYRMGYDAVETYAHADLLEHSVLPDEWDLSQIPVKAFIPVSLVYAAGKVQAAEKSFRTNRANAVARCRTEGAWRRFADCYRKLEQTTTARGEQPLLGRHYHRSEREAGLGMEEVQDDFATPVKVGSSDLDKSRLAGKLLVMASCSSHFHFFAPLDRRRKAVGSRCRFLLTAHVCTANLPVAFLENVLQHGMDPTTDAGMKALADALSGVPGSGAVQVY